ncbi:hypothetical protein L1887_29316 [Cichorium endivia]|nr:hypothetical protein L1887_29316 [Cichorium endivia]
MYSAEAWYHQHRHTITALSTAHSFTLIKKIKAQTLDFPGSFFEGGFGSEDKQNNTPMAAVDEKEEPQCPPVLRQYETMAVLRPDMSEDERLYLT